eukprot:CAMPEP_0178900088 /NCGR_PEP_ID=MMETSP0786-20121207/3275_1 /TAXON_ID=186022 /ORGANISM="Thalassionema frauenfeldii, Strain CCMP 1798" /LENGTH=310 /DNA_ID=CAMNT_0020571045 /DNA_START=153 /DNA_END=1085 /DNA_ORIENTATION=-
MGQTNMFGDEDEDDNFSVNLQDYKDILPKDVQVREQKRAEVLNSWVERERQRQRLAASHFAAKSYYLHFFPVSALTLASGIISLIFAVEYDDGGDHKRAVNADLTVFLAGVLSLITTFWNATGERANWTGKLEQHNLATLQLQRMDIELDAVLITGIKTPADVKKIGRLQNEVLGIPRNLTSLLPSEIVEAFTLLETRIATLYSTQQVIRNVYKRENELQKIAYGELAGVISSYFGFPLILPPPKCSVKKALQRFQKSIKANATLFDDVEVALSKNSCQVVHTIQKTRIQEQQKAPFELKTRDSSDKEDA